MALRNPTFTDPLSTLWNQHLRHGLRLSDSTIGYYQLSGVVSDEEPLVWMWCVPCLLPFFVPLADRPWSARASSAAPMSVPKCDPLHPHH